MKWPCLSPSLLEKTPHIHAHELIESDDAEQKAKENQRKESSEMNADFSTCRNDTRRYSRLA